MTDETAKFAHTTPDHATAITDIGLPTQERFRDVAARQHVESLANRAGGIARHEVFAKRLRANEFAVATTEYIPAYLVNVRVACGGEVSC